MSLDKLSEIYGVRVLPSRAEAFWLGVCPAAMVLVMGLIGLLELWAASTGSFVADWIRGCAGLLWLGGVLVVSLIVGCRLGKRVAKLAMPGKRGFKRVCLLLGLSWMFLGGELLLSYVVGLVCVLVWMSLA